MYVCLNCVCVSREFCQNNFDELKLLFAIFPQFIGQCSYSDAKHLDDQIGLKLVSSTLFLSIKWSTTLYNSCPERGIETGHFIDKNK
jgi:hypothetical protein